VKSIADPSSTQLTKDNKRVTTDVNGPANHPNDVGKTTNFVNTANKDFFTDKDQWEKDATKGIAAFFTDNTGWEKASNQAISNFFSDETQWEKSANRAIGDFFSDQTGWQKASNHAIGDFFNDKTQWEQSANKAIEDFFSGNSGWEKAAGSLFNRIFISDMGQWAKTGANAIVGFFTQTVPHWFDSFTGVWNRNVSTPTSNFVTKTIPNFFTTSIPHWFDSFAGVWDRNVSTPTSNFITKSIPNFFTQTIPHWFDSFEGTLDRDVYDPTSNFVTKDIPNFFTQTIPHWFDSFVGVLNRDVYDPVDNFIMKTIPNFFTSSIPNWFKDVGDSFNKDVITPIGNWLTGTGSNSLTGLFKSGFEDAINGVIDQVFNNGIIRLINDAIHLVDNNVSIPGIPHVTLATGGQVPGNMGEPDNSDSQWAKLTPGEYVIRKKAVGALGTDLLDYLNHADTNGAAPRFADGGMYGAYADGGTAGPGQGAPVKVTAPQQGGASTGAAAEPNPGGGLISQAGALADSIGGTVLSFVKGALKDTFDLGWSAVVQPFVNKMASDNTIPNSGHGPGPSAAEGAMIGMIDTVKKTVDTYLGAQDAQAQAQAAKSVNLPGTAAQWIAQGMAAAGVSGTDWQQGLDIIAEYESGGQQSVVNTTDSNAAAGNPSAGLMQFTQSTFDAYAKPGYTTWMNPIDQVVADAWANGYINKRYGGIDNVPGVKAVRAGQQYVGYASGGAVGMPNVGFAGTQFTPVNLSGIGSLKSEAAAGANGGRSGAANHTENWTIHNPIPERVSESYSNVLQRKRVFGANP
jgi:transglycosylase-like protein with SLT domain